jgi:uncharacterized membrane protein YiaA
MNWGKGIAIALALFMGFIIYLGVTLMSQDVDLETEDYYLREMAYDEEIKAIQNANNGEKIKVKNEDEQIVVVIPSDEDYEDVLIEFNRPNNEKMDKEFKMEGTKTMVISYDMLQKGKYNLTITYLSDGKPCLQKEEIYI